MTMITYLADFIHLTHVDTPYADAAGTQLSRAQITRHYSGQAEGESSAELLLCQTPSGVMSYAGTDQFKGRLGGRLGTFVFQHAGIVENGSFQGFGFVVPGSATSELADLRGSARVAVSAGGSHTLVLEIEAKGAGA